MKISKNWIEEFTSTGLLDELVQKIGAQLGAVEEVIDIGKRYQGLRIVKVVSVAKHSDADKLSVCLIDDGGEVKDVKRDDDGYVQVVCGAPNVAQDMFAVWVPPGATVPNTLDAKEPLVVDSREIRGVVSHGMLASANELGIGDDHSGIVDLGSIKAPAGSLFVDTYKLDDSIIDIENKMFTHRPDCFGVLGVAREVAGIYQQKFSSPEWYLEQPDFPATAETLPLNVENNITDKVPRFMAVALELPKNSKSPIWLQVALSKLGFKPINLVVDIANYVMALTAQPLHAYDYDKVASLSGAKPTVRARLSTDKEQVTLLGNKTISLEAGSIVISTDKEVIGIAGVMGGKNTEVDESTTKIILEVATFDMYSIRKTSMKTGLFTDAVTRYTKGQSPHQCDRVLAYAVDMLINVANAKVAGPVIDIKGELKANNTITVDSEFINNRLGTSLGKDEVASLLTNVEFDVGQDGDQLKITAPFWRTDISIKEDIVEEVGRLHGYDNLQIQLPTRPALATSRNKSLDLKAQIRELLASAGANEVLTYSFIKGDLLEVNNQWVENSYQLSNALSPDLQYYRQAIVPSLLSKVHANIKSGYQEFAIFEMGKIYDKTKLDASNNNLPTDQNRLGFVFAASDKISEDSYSGAPFYQARYYLDYLLKGVGVDYQLEQVSDQDKPVFSYFATANGRCAYIKIDNERVGIISEVAGPTRKKLKLPMFTAGFEIDLDKLSGGRSNVYNKLSRFPHITQDITFIKPKNKNAGQVTAAITDQLNKIIDQTDESVDVQTIDFYQKNDGEVHITLRVKAVSYSRTMLAKEVNDLLDQACKDIGLKRV